MLNEQEARIEIVRLGRLMHQFEFVDGGAGNLSARVGPDRILVTPSGLAKGFLQVDQMLAVTSNGELCAEQTEAARKLRPTSELPMHLEAYRKRADVNAVVHAHPITTIALSIAGISLAECLIPEAVVILGMVPTTPYSTPASDENRAAISKAIESHDVIVLEYHGSLTVGKDLWDAYKKLEVLEHTAKIVAMARLLGGDAPSPRPVDMTGSRRGWAALPPDQVVKLMEARRQGGFSRPQDEEDFCRQCGVCHPRGEHTDLDVLIAAVSQEVRRALHSDGK